MDYSKYTGRNAILYYSGWMEMSHFRAPGLTRYSVSDEDENGFMAAVHGLDRSKGLDLILHTPGGDITDGNGSRHLSRVGSGLHVRTGRRIDL